MPLFVNSVAQFTAYLANDTCYTYCTVIIYTGRYYLYDNIR